MLYQVIYSSQSTTPMQTEDLEDLLESARESNEEAGISGALVYVDGSFLQVLEGEAQSVLALMGRISKDLRHEAVRVLRQEEVPFAIFSDWTMAYVSATPEQVARWAGLSATATLPHVLADIQDSALKAQRVTEQIRKVLDAEPLHRQSSNGGSAA